MRKGVPWRTLPSRATALLALILLPLAGCLGGDEGADPDVPRAVPTDRISVPLGRPITPPPAVNFSDAGYKMEGSWRVGDAWDYESNQSRKMLLRVIDSRVLSNTNFFLLETTRLDAGGEVEAVTRTWVEGRTWSRVNHTDEQGNLDRFSPGAPLRFYKNGTATYNQTRFDASGKLLTNETVRLQSYLHPAHETIQAKFGEYYEARKVEQVTVASDASGIRSRTLAKHWVHRLVLNDVAFQLENGEKYTITAYEAGDTRRGTLAG